MIVVSGESGAGKTYTASRILEYLANATASRSSRSSARWLSKRVVATNPILEAFGNAGTSLNKNSSRFGKLTRLRFSRGGQITGATLEVGELACGAAFEECALPATCLETPGAQLSPLLTRACFAVVCLRQTFLLERTRVTNQPSGEGTCRRERQAAAVLHVQARFTSRES